MQGTSLHCLIRIFVVEIADSGKPLARSNRAISSSASDLPRDARANLGWRAGFRCPSSSPPSIKHDDGEVGLSVPVGIVDTAIIKVGDSAVAGGGISNDKIKRLLKGPGDSKVTVTLLRAGETGGPPLVGQTQ